MVTCGRLAGFTRRSILVLVAAAAGQSGCAGRWQEELRRPQSQPETQTFDLRPYLEAWRFGRWTYERSQPGHEGPPQQYTRITGPTRMTEGRLLGREIRPLGEYIHQPVPTSRPAEHRRIKPPLQGGTGFMFELLVPMEPFPASLKPGQRITSATPIIYCEYDGRMLARGTLTRLVEIDGIEDVSCPAGEYADCLRIRLDMTVTLPWLLHLDWSSYLWLSRQVGEVRRLEHMSGWFVVFPFESTHEYALVAGRPFPPVAGAPVSGEPRWQFGAVLLNRAVPSPEIGGLVVDFAGRPSATSSAPAE